MWKVTTKKRDDGAMEVGATFTSLDGLTTFGYSATTKPDDFDTFAANANAALVKYQEGQVEEVSFVQKIEAILNQ